MSELIALYLSVDDYPQLHIVHSTLKLQSNKPLEDRPIVRPFWYCQRETVFSKSRDDVQEPSEGYQRVKIDTRNSVSLFFLIIIITTTTTP